MKNIVPLVARILIAQIFVVAGVEKMLDPAGTQQYMASKGMPLTWLFLLGAIAVELGGGLSVLLGFFTRIGAAALFLFLIPTTLIFHTKFSEPLQVIMFMKNLAIMGGLLMLVHAGAGSIRLDALLLGRARRGKSITEGKPPTPGFS